MFSFVAGRINATFVPNGLGRQGGDKGTDNLVKLEGSCLQAKALVKYTKALIFMVI
jgi:hypothetical protein